MKTIHSFLLESAFQKQGNEKNQKTETKPTEKKSKKRKDNSR